MTAQPFPEGARLHSGFCAGVFCRDGAQRQDVVESMVGPSYRQALAMDLCSDCLADFALGSTDETIYETMRALGLDVGRMHVWARGQDGLFHEVAGHL